MVEIYPACSNGVVSQAFLQVLERGWNEVFNLLKKIGVGEIADLDLIEVTLLDDAEMGRIHGEFLDDSSPTDVITFEHGELLVGVETAVRQADSFGSSVGREVALYGIHGMLHLAGFDDRGENEARIMAKRQEELLAEFFPAL